MQAGSETEQKEISAALTPDFEGFVNGLSSCAVEEKEKQEDCEMENMEAFVAGLDQGCGTPEVTREETSEIFQEEQVEEQNFPEQDQQKTPRPTLRLHPKKSKLKKERGKE